MIEVIRKELIAGVSFELVRFTHDMHDYSDDVWYTRRQGKLSIVNCVTFEFDDINNQRTAYSLTGKFRESSRYKYGVRLKYRILMCLHFGCKMEEIDHHRIHQPLPFKVTGDIGDWYGGKVPMKNAKPELEEHDNCTGCIFQNNHPRYCEWGRRINQDGTPRAKEKCFKVTRMQDYTGVEVPGDHSLAIEVK